MTTIKVDRKPVTPQDHKVTAVMKQIGRLIDQGLGGEYGGVIVFLKVGGPKGDPPHEFYIQSPMSNELVIWTLSCALEQCKACLGQ